MEITTITVRYGRTANLGNYSNCRPEVELTADVSTLDEPERVTRLLLDEARARVLAIVDEDREAEDLPAKYDTDSPRYDVLASRGNSYRYTPLTPSIVAIVPAGTAEPDDYYVVLHGLRRAHAERVAARALRSTPGSVLMIISDGSELPGQPEEAPAPTEEAAEAPF